MLAKLRYFRKALRLYEALLKGDTALLIEYFPFVKAALAPPVAPLRKVAAPPKITHRARTEEEELREALDIGFNALKFEPLERDDARRAKRR